MVPCPNQYPRSPERAVPAGGTGPPAGWLAKADGGQLVFPVNDDVEVGWTPVGTPVGVTVVVEVTLGVGVGVTVVGAANSTSFAMRKPWTRTPSTNTRSPRWMPCVILKVFCVAVMV